MNIEPPRVFLLKEANSFLECSSVYMRKLLKLHGIPTFKNPTTRITKYGLEYLASKFYKFREPPTNEIITIYSFMEEFLFDKIYRDKIEYSYKHKILLASYVNSFIGENDLILNDSICARNPLQALTNSLKSYSNKCRLLTMKEQCIWEIIYFRLWTIHYELKNNIYL